MDEIRSQKLHDISTIMMFRAGQFIDSSELQLKAIISCVFEDTYYICWDKFGDPIFYTLERFKQRNGQKSLSVF